MKGERLKMRKMNRKSNMIDFQLKAPIGVADRGGDECADGDWELAVKCSRASGRGEEAAFRGGEPLFIDQGEVAGCRVLG